MHIHPNSSLILATLGLGREELREVQAKRAAEVRRKLSSVSRAPGDAEEFSDRAMRVEQRAYGGSSRQGEEDTFGSLFSADA